MAITSEIIGKLGGRVEVVPVSGEATGGSGSVEVLHTIQVPPGEIWLISAIGDFNPRYTTNNLAPDVYLGNQKSNGFLDKGTLSMSFVGEGEVTFRIRRNNSSGTDSFTGHVYTVKM